MELFRLLPKSSVQHGVYTVRRFSARSVLSSTPRSSPPSTPQSSSATSLRTRLQKLNYRLPSFLRGYTTPLISAPATHITSFLFLHEITAVAPLFGLFAIFHYSGWTPLPSSTREDGALNEAVQRFGKWLAKKGWVGSEDVEAAKSFSNNPITSENGTESPSQIISQKGGVQLVLQFATAYVITKAILPIRIVASVWATPWFARVLLVPIGRRIKSGFGRT